MTDRYNQLVVVLEEDVREDDAQALMNAIRMLRGVISVEGNVVASADYAATIRAKFELGLKVREFLKP